MVEKDLAAVERKLASLGGLPLQGTQTRGGKNRLIGTRPSELKSGKPGTWKQLDQLYLVPVDIENTSADTFDPWRDTPTAYLEFADVGEIAWRIGLEWTDRLIEAIDRYQERYGFLWLHRDGHFKIPSVGEIARKARDLRLAVMCHQAITDPESGPWNTVAVRIALYFNGQMSETLGLVGEPARRLKVIVQTSRDEWLEMSTATGEPDEIVLARIKNWMHQKINKELQSENLVLQIQEVEDRGEVLFHKNDSLHGALWVQFAQQVANRSTHKLCKYEQCQRVFVSKNHRAEYCTESRDGNKSSCKELARSRRRYKKKRESINVSTSA